MSPEKFETSYIPEPNSGCWIWERGATTAGYGAVRLGGKSDYAHRMSYRMFKGDIPEKSEVRHTCDNKCCVNPDHLVLGSHAQNMRDMAERKRGHKLTDVQVMEIKRDRRPKRQIASAYGIALCYVYHIQTGIANRLCVKERRV